MKRSQIEVAGIKFKNPVIAASGTFGYGSEYSELVDLEKIGGFVTKSITLKPTSGNRSPRICEVAGGMLNSIGLQNEGLDYFLKEKLPLLRDVKTNVIVSIAGFNEKEYVEMAAVLNREKGICAIELNLSCPNVKDGKGGNTGVLHFAQDKKVLYSVVRNVKRKSKIPIMVKLTPNVTDITILAKTASDAGADALTLINTPLGMAVDINKKKPKIKSVIGGLSGPAIKPIALRMLWQAANAVKIPLIGVGGISTWEDALEFMLCGAALVQVGTASFIDPDTLVNIAEGIEKYAEKNNLESVQQIVGGLILE
ncbi:MAG: dihydroorotate dehydrogenase [Candidatus Omnitrophota bacterium]